MQAIRKINPQAKLIQTEDLAKTFSTPLLAFQAAFENERRWVTFDLLCGRLTKGMAMYNYFRRLGIEEAELQFFIDNPCPPDIMGCNYYITSERFLDDALHNHNPSTHGGNEVVPYADVEAIRMSHTQPWGLKVLIREAWERFKLPVAITECHLSCTREEQLRWVKACYDDLIELKSEGIDVRALTAWALCGAYGWNRLLTDPAMQYESGVFDTSDGSLRETALAVLIRSLAARQALPVKLKEICSQPGWWHTNGGLKKSNPAIAPFWVVNAGEALKEEFKHIGSLRKLPYRFLSTQEFNALMSDVEAPRPWGYIAVQDGDVQVPVPKTLSVPGVVLQIGTADTKPTEPTDHLRVTIATVPGLALGAHSNIRAVLHQLVDHLIDENTGQLVFPATAIHEHVV